MFGFSAGAQFVHRFIQFKPNARFDKVVAGAAGWYTVPDNTIPFPYGYENSILNTANLDNLLSSDLYIQVGALDNNPNSAGLRHNEYADAQGLNRVTTVSYTHLRAHETLMNLVCRLLLEKKNKKSAAVL